MATTQPAPPRLRRSTHDRVIFGVCSGLGAYFQIDPVLMRLVFVFATLAGGSGVPLYVILAIVIPPETDGEPLTPALLYQASLVRQRSAELIGAFLAIVGLYLLAGNLGWLPWLSGGVFWSLVLIGVGAYVLLLHGTRHADQPQA